MPLDSFSAMNIHAGQLSAIGNRQAFAAQLSGMGGMSTFAAPQAGPSPFMQNVMNVASMGLQTGGAIPGSTQQQLQAQQMGMGILGMAISEQTPILGGMFQNMQGQAALNQQLQQNFTFARPGGFGFNYQQMQGINQGIGQMATQNPMWTQQQMRNVAGMGMQMGMFRGTQDVYDFQQKFRQLVRSAEQITRTLGGTLEEGVQAIARMRGMGVFRTADQMRMAQALPGMAAASGTSVGQLQQFGGQVAQMLRPLGVQAPAGAQAGMQALATLGTGQQMGVINEQQIWQATGMGGVAGQQALGARMMQIGARFTKRTGGKIMMAAFIDPNTKEFDDESWQKFQSGQMSFAEVQSKAHANIRDMGGYLGWQQNEGRIRGEFMSGTQGMGGLFAMRKAFEGHWGDPRKAQMILRRQMHMSREEAEVFAPIMQQLPEIMREQEYAGKVAEQQAERQAAFQARSPQARMRQGMQSLKQKYLGWVDKAMNQFVDSFTNEMNKGMEEYAGMLTAELTPGARARMAQMMTTTEGRRTMTQRMTAAQGLLEQGFVVSGGGLRMEAGKLTATTTGLLGAGLGGKVAQAKQWLMRQGGGMGGAAGFAQGMQRWGLGQGRTFGTAGEAMRQAGEGDVVVMGPAGGFGLFHMDAKQRKRMAQYHSGNITMEDPKVWGMSESDYKNIISKDGMLLSEATSLIESGKFEEARASIRKMGAKAGKDLQEHQVSAIATRLSKNVGKESPLYMLGGGDMPLSASLKDTAGRAIGSLSQLTGFTESQINTWLQNPTYQDKLIKAAQTGNFGALQAELMQGGETEAMRFFGQIRGTGARGTFKEAVGALVGMQGAQWVERYQGLGKFILRGGVGEKVQRTLGGQMPLELMGTSKERMAGKVGGKAGELLRAMAGPAMDALAEGKWEGIGASESINSALQQAIATSTPAQLASMAETLRAGGAEGAQLAEMLESESGLARRAKKSMGKLRKEALGLLAGRVGLEGATDAEKRAYKSKLARGLMPKGMDPTRVMELSQLIREEEDLGKRTQLEKERASIQLLTGGKDERVEAATEMQRIKEQEQMASRSTMSEAHPETVKLHPDTLKGIETAVARGMNARDASTHDQVVGEMMDSMKKIIDKYGGGKE